MPRIVILDHDHPLRETLAELLSRSPGMEIVFAADAVELERRVRQEVWNAIFADDLLLGDSVPRIIGSIRTSPVLPIMVIASNERPDQLDPDFITMVVRKPYDVGMVAGVLLSAVSALPSGPDAGDRARQAD